MIVDEWKGCYPSAWRGLITPESFSHPAKGSSRLAERIYKHAIDEGWLHEHSTVIDPFGGIGGFAFHAMLNGMDMTLVELEPKFCALAQANIDAWNAKYSGRLARWGTARIIQGDSRHLAQVIASANACISSPPYHDALNQESTDPVKRREREERYVANHPEIKRPAFRDYGETPGQLSNLPTGHLAQVIGAAEACISSPPYASAAKGIDAAEMDKKMKIANDLRRERGDITGGIGRSGRMGASILAPDGYGSTPGNLGNLPPGDVDACISSPPYQTETEGAGLNINKPASFRGVLKDGTLSMGTTPGQLASLPPGAPPFDGCVSSPPFEENDNRGNREAFDKLQAAIVRDGNGHGGKLGPSIGNDYGSSAGQLGNDSGETFWSAAREIVAQVYQVLAPGAHAIWVVKSYVKNKQLVDFPHQWQTLCESVGFVTLHEHHALLVRHGATSIDIDGNHHEKKTESKSFFRRLAEKNGSPRIDFETVLCMVKPGSEGGGWDGAISSPPYASIDVNDKSRVKSEYRGIYSQNDTNNYGQMPGQLGALPPGSLDDATRHGGGG